MSTAAALDFAPGLERAFAHVPEERAYALRPGSIEGRLPDYVRGSYYLNGPARFSFAGLRYRHWLDGDGLVVALHFDEGGVRVAQRFVRSAKWRDEQQAGRPLYRTFGTSFPGDRLVHGLALASPANVSVFPFAGRLLAFGEQGLPFELDPDTLETRGEFTFGGALNSISPFAAHPKIDARSGELWNFGVSFSAAQPCLHLYRFDPRGALLRRRRVPLEAPVSLHDFALGPRHALFYLAPYALDMQALARDGATLMDALRFEPSRGSRLLVVPREGDTPAFSLPLGAGYSLHTINACEDRAAGTLTLDCLELERPVYDQYQVVPELFTSVGPGRPVRLVIDLHAQALVERRAVDYALAPDFAALDLRRSGAPCDDFWMLGISAAGRPGRKFLDQLVHARWSAPSGLDVWTAPAGTYLGGEPVFVGAPEGEHGSLLCPLYDSRREASALALFDAHDVAAGPRALLKLESPIHLGFHATFDARRK